jgi:predicted O-methyltransferase YrrM
MASKFVSNSYGTIKEKLIRHFSIKTWSFWERLGFYIVPRHFYWPIPDTVDIENYDFDKMQLLSGIVFNDSKMFLLLSKIKRYMKEYTPIHVDSGYASNGDGAILYGLVRELNPANILEVGSGYSTQIIHAALNNNCKGMIHSIEPYPKKVLLELERNNVNVKLTRSKVEDVDIEVFKGLSDGDILFIDTSHVLKTANDVHYLYLNVLPQLSVGVIVHIHDIRLPQDYPREWVCDAKKIWHEQYMLQMFLTFNENFEVMFASNYLYCKNPQLMSDSLISLSLDGNGWPGSFWIKRIK